MRRRQSCLFFFFVAIAPVAPFCMSLGPLDARVASQETQGLTLEVALDKADYNPDSLMTIEIRVVNTSENSVFVEKSFGPFRERHHTWFTVWVEPVKTDSVVSGRGVLSGITDGTPPISPDDFSELEPRYFLGTKHVQALQAYVRDSETGLPPPGLYQLTVEYRREPSPAEKSWSFQPWHGTLKSNPVRFRVVSLKGRVPNQ